MNRFYPHFSPLVEQFDAFIIDLWGVLHDGSHPYPGAIECLDNLKRSGKEIVLLSNAPRRASKAEQRMGELGFQRTSYDHILTSGEITYRAIEAKWKGGLLGSKYFYIGPIKDEDLLEGLSGVTPVVDAKEADFALVTGFDAFNQPFESKLHLLEASLAAKLPFYCANPDRVVVNQAGDTHLCSGLMAEWYEERGGLAYWFGKPYQPTYEACFELLHTKNRKRIACIGDSLHTDIAGGAGVGIHTILSASGIHHQDLACDHEGCPHPDALVKLCQKEQQTPDSIIPGFFW